MSKLLDKVLSLHCYGKGAHKFCAAPLKKIDPITLESLYSKGFCSIYYMCQDYNISYSKGSIRGYPAYKKSKTMKNNIEKTLSGKKSTPRPENSKDQAQVDGEREGRPVSKKNSLLFWY